MGFTRCGLTIAGGVVERSDTRDINDGGVEHGRYDSTGVRAPGLG